MLAIVIPYFKIEFFEECLDSLAKQTSSNFKVYIGNDNSADDPAKIINKYSELISLSYFKFKKNLGGTSLVRQWYRCIDLVENEQWVMILGDDDILEPKCVEDFEKNFNEIENRKIRVVRYATMKINEKSEIISKLFTHPKIESSIHFLFKKIHGETRSSLSEYIFRKIDLEKKSFKELPLAWHSDDLAFLEFSNFGEMYAINTSCVYFRNSGINISSMNTNLGEKNKASFLFYYYLLFNYREFFKKEEEEILYSKLEKSFLNGKTEVDFYFKYIELRFKNLKTDGSFKFTRSYLKSILKSKKLKSIFSAKRQDI